MKYLFSDEDVFSNSPDSYQKRPFSSFSVVIQLISKLWYLKSYFFYYIFHSSLYHYNLKINFEFQCLDPGAQSRI